MIQEEIILNGARSDPRPIQLRQLDYSHPEILGGNIPTILWKNKEWVTLDIRRQLNSTSCGAQSLAKALTAFTGTICSALPPFDSRSNFPGPGMYLQEVGSLGLHLGSGSEKDYPSENMTDEQLNALKQVYSALPYRISAYYTVAIDMDTIAQALSKGHAVILALSSNVEEWIDIPKVIQGSHSTFSHFVVCHSKNYGFHNGLKVLCIDDSCNLVSTLAKDDQLTGQRFITEDFFKTRVWEALALIPFEESVMVKPIVKLTKNLYLWMRDPEVKEWQNVLKYEGLFPKEVDSTGYFGNLTKNATIKFQQKYADFCLVPAGINTGVGTGYVGSFTRSCVNKLYE